MNCLGAVYLGRPRKISYFQTTPCPDASEFLQNHPLPGRPRPDFPTIIIKHYFYTFFKVISTQLPLAVCQGVIRCQGA